MTVAKPTLLTDEINELALHLSDLDEGKASFFSSINEKETIKALDDLMIIANQLRSLDIHGSAKKQVQLLLNTIYYLINEAEPFDFIGVCELLQASVLLYEHIQYCPDCTNTKSTCALLEYEVHTAIDLVRLLDTVA